MSDNYLQWASTLVIAERHSAVDKTVRFLLNPSVATIECARRTLRELDEPSPHVVLSNWVFPAMNATHVVEMLVDWHTQSHPRAKCSRRSKR